MENTGQNQEPTSEQLDLKSYETRKREIESIRKRLIDTKWELQLQIKKLRKQAQDLKKDEDFKSFLETLNANKNNP